jgi:hypothetical protein
MSKTFTLLMATIFGAMVGWGLGYTTGEYIGERSQPETITKTEAVGWCVKTNAEADLAYGYSVEEVSEAMPAIFAYCERTLEEFMIWIEEKRAELKAREPEASLLEGEEYSL